MTRESGELRVFETPADVAKALADVFAECGRHAINERGRFTVALSGGTTPKAAYELLATPTYRSALNWKQVEVFFGDERCVPPDDPQSNYKMAHNAFLAAVGVPDSNIHRIRGEDDPADAAAAYRTKLVNVLGNTPQFDLVMLGMGPDGHTSSLFPGSDPLDDDAKLVRAVYAPSQKQWRVTITPRVINHARTDVFAVEGAGKARTLKAVREGPYDPSKFPSQIVAPNDGRLIWLVDRAAAG
jgi:6-phosphogluconolactonase